MTVLNLRVTKQEIGRGEEVLVMHCLPLCSMFKDRVVVFVWADFIIGLPSLVLRNRIHMDPPSFASWIRNWMPVHLKWRNFEKCVCNRACFEVCLAKPIRINLNWEISLTEGTVRQKLGIDKQILRKGRSGKTFELKNKFYVRYSPAKTNKDQNGTNINFNGINR